MESATIDRLLALKPQIKLLASKKVLEVFEKLFNYITGKYSEYQNFCDNNDPRNDSSNYRFDEEIGDEIFMGDYIDFEYKCATEKLRISAELKAEYVAMVKELVMCMRSDINTKDF